MDSKTDDCWDTLRDKNFCLLAIGRETARGFNRDLLKKVKANPFTDN